MRRGWARPFESSLSGVQGAVCAGHREPQRSCLQGLQVTGAALLPGDAALGRMALGPPARQVQRARRLGPLSPAECRRLRQGTHGLPAGPRSCLPLAARAFMGVGMVL